MTKSHIIIRGTYDETNLIFKDFSGMLNYIIKYSSIFVPSPDIPHPLTYSIFFDTATKNEQLRRVVHSYTEK